jgi:hypothetical protein
MTEPYEVTFEMGPTRGGRTWDSREEAEAAAERMRQSGVIVTSVHPAPRYPWPTQPIPADAENRPLTGAEISRCLGEQP